MKATFPLSILASLLLCLCCYVNPVYAGSAVEDTLYAKKLYDGKKYSEAIRYLNDAVRADPKLSEPYGLRAFTYFKLGQYANAAADYTNFLKLQPGNKNMYHLRGHCYFLIGKYDQAIDDFTKAIEFAPLGVSLYKLRGEAYLQKGEYQKAVDDLSQAMVTNDKLKTFATANAGRFAAEITGIKDLATTKVPSTDYPQNKQEVAEILHFRAIALEKMGKADLAQKDRVAEKGWGGYQPHDPRDRM